MSSGDQPSSEVLARLGELFGAHKAEWFGPRLFDLFAEPNYFPRMTTARPCILVGGRGTGKTTVLRGLSYQGQFALQKRNPQTVAAWPYYGLYYRVDTNRVSAFKGPELSESQWSRKFGHYINLLLCVQVLRFLSWFHTTAQIPTDLSTSEREQIATALHLPPPENNEHLLKLLQNALTEFEAHINNVADGKGPPLSLQGAPVQILLESIRRQIAFHDKLFFFLIDEYENLEDYQQRLVNTLIKHAGELYTFKIGVRELGWRVRNTLNENEQLISPADYVRIDITHALQGAQFEEFAHRVCSDRLALLVEGDGQKSSDIQHLLPGLSEEEEAKLLGVDEHNLGTLQTLRRMDPQGIMEDLRPLQIYLLDYWARSQNLLLSEVFEDFRRDRQTWETRLSNYRHALLYTLRRGRRGIRKYYAGWDTFIQLSGGNIRFLLQLVEESLTLHLRADNTLRVPLRPDVQTQAAQRIGRMNLTELEGLSVRGARLTKLLLGLGRVFGVMAASPEGHAPEVNQFEVAKSPGQMDELRETDALLTAAVMHLALVRWSGSKPADEGDTRDWDYMVHPVFVPFFNFSYRRKRKMQLTTAQLLALVASPRQAIRMVLAASNRTPDEPLPEQLRLFEMYYADSP